MCIYPKHTYLRTLWSDICEMELHLIRLQEIFSVKQEREHTPKSRTELHCGRRRRNQVLTKEAECVE